MKWKLNLGNLEHQQNSKIEVVYLENIMLSETSQLGSGLIHLQEVTEVGKLRTRKQNGARGGVILGSPGSKMGLMCVCARQVPYPLHYGSGPSVLGFYTGLGAFLVSSLYCCCLSIFEGCEGPQCFVRTHPVPSLLPWKISPDFREQVSQEQSSMLGKEKCVLEIHHPEEQQETRLLS